VRLMRVGPPGQERPAVLVEDRLLDITSLVDDIDGALLSSGALPAVAGVVAAGELPELSLDLRVGPPLSGIGKVVCIGLNYLAHIEETGSEVPTEPTVFMKASNTVVGAEDDVFVPRNSVKTDYEVELAIVIGRTARYLDSPADARACIAGYAISNDVSERELQLERGGTWDKGKSCETFNPLGPWLVTADEVPDPQALGLRLWVNGELRQDSTTKDMAFGVDHIVWYLSQLMVLDPGDIVNTGTPAGVAMGLPGQPYLVAGDVVELEIDGLGRQRQTMRQA
jgi:2-keto-4-pentenoate hydratase/2-oxohepta-3-ene-1,7-dioic acid hydratase in catechol pathway